MGKHMFQSKTFWVNLLSAVATFVPQVQDAIPDQYKPTAVAVLAGVNIGLRWITSAPVHVVPNTQR